MEIPWENGPMLWTMSEEKCKCRMRVWFQPKNYPPNDDWPCVTYDTCWDCQRAEEERTRIMRERVENRHLERLASGDSPETILAPPQGAISDQTLEKMGIYACPGYSVGVGCSANTKHHPCKHGSILFRNYGKGLRGDGDRCEECKKMHDWKWVRCDNRCACGNI